MYATGWLLEQFRQLQRVQTRVMHILYMLLHALTPHNLTFLSKLEKTFQL